jgi:nucleotide-binding universal stress UspA family protein
MSFFDSILAIADFSAASERALDRAALLASQHGAPLRLIYFSQEPHRYLTDPLARLAQRARQLARRHGIRALALQRHPIELHHIVEESRASGLLVVGPQWRRNWKTFLVGTQLDHLVRQSRCPVLVVRQTASRDYADVLVAVDLSPRSRELIHFASEFAHASKVQLFHAINTVEESRLRLADVPLETIQANRLDARQRARERLLPLMRTLASRGNAVDIHVGNGDPAYQAAVEQQAIRAELVVVGMRRASTLLSWLLGSVAQRLARWAEGDVLVVPLDRLVQRHPEEGLTSWKRCVPTPRWPTP